MSIEAIVDKIIEDAQKEAENILNSACRDADDAEKKGFSEIENILSVLIEKAGVEAEKYKERQRIAGRMMSKKQDLEEKQKVVSCVLELAINEIRNMDKADYQKLVQPQLLLGEGDEEIIIPEDEKRIDNQFIEKINKVFLERGKKAGLKISKERKYIQGGGFILKKENVESNNAFSVVLDSIRNKIEADISRILFEKNNGKNKVNNK